MGGGAQSAQQQREAAGLERERAERAERAERERREVEERGVLEALSEEQREEINEAVSFLPFSSSFHHPSVLSDKRRTMKTH